MKTQNLILSLIFIAFSSSAFALKCNEIPMPSGPMSYCTPDEMPTVTDSVDVVYFFHGLAGSAQQVNGMDVVAEGVRAAIAPKPVVFIGISTGSHGVLKENSAELNQVGLPALEAYLFGKAQVNRHLMGLSMGGHNIGRLAAEDPSLIKSMSLLCPALVTFNPNDQAELDAFKERNKDLLYMPLFKMVLATYNAYFPTTETWNANNPMQFLKAGRYGNLPMFLSIGTEDNLGFYEGSEAWVSIAREQGNIVDFRPLGGKHCALDGSALKDFLVLQMKR